MKKEPARGVGHLVVPRKLLTLPGVTVIAAHQDSAILYKELEQELWERPLFSRAICLTVILEGKKKIRFADDQIILDTNQGVFLPKEFMAVSDLFARGSRFKQYLLFFEDDIIQEFVSRRRLSLARESADLTFRIAAEPGFLDYLAGLAATFKNLKRNQNMLRVKLLEALEWMADANPAVSQWLFAAIHSETANLQWVMENHFNSGLNVEDFALLSGRSLSSFQRDFKRTFGTSPARWIRERKLQRAAELLEGNQDVTTVALEIGFENISHFIRLFKQEFGASPAEYRRTRAKSGPFKKE